MSLLTEQSESVVQIPNGADLNDYRTPGVYRCNYASNAATLANSPTTTGGFTLYVERTNGSAGYIKQRVVTSNGNGREYWRVSTSTTAWGHAWELFEPKTVTNGTLTYADAYPNANGSTILKKQGNIVNLYIRYVESDKIPEPKSAGWITIATLPSSYRPSVQMYCPGINNSASTTSQMPLEFRINTNGEVQCYLFKEGLSYLPILNVSFIVE